MPDYRGPETLLIRRQEGEAARKRRELLRRWRPPPKPIRNRAETAMGAGSGSAPAATSLCRLSLPGTLIAKKLKATVVLDAAELLVVPAPECKPRVTLRINLPGRFVTAELAAQSLRTAQRAIREAGADYVALVLQGHLTADDTIAEAGLSAQPKAAKPRQAP
jgi:hypothetical protein